MRISQSQKRKHVVRVTSAINFTHRHQYKSSSAILRGYAAGEAPGQYRGESPGEAPGQYRER
jgi:hypothetical protein